MQRLIQYSNCANTDCFSKFIQGKPYKHLAVEACSNYAMNLIEMLVHDKLCTSQIL